MDARTNNTLIFGDIVWLWTVRPLCSPERSHFQNLTRRKAVLKLFALRDSLFQVLRFLSFGRPGVVFVLMAAGRILPFLFGVLVCSHGCAFGRWPMIPRCGVNLEWKINIWDWNLSYLVIFGHFGRFWSFMAIFVSVVHILNIFF